MTDYSLRITAFPCGATVEDLKSYSLKVPVVQSLSEYARDCGPYRLSSWAEPRGHALYYVNNCWARAHVHGRDIPDFFSIVLKGRPALDPDIDPQAEYLIEADEY